MSIKIDRVGRFLGFCLKSTGTVGIIPTLKWMLGTAQVNLNLRTPSYLKLRPSSLQHSVKLRACTSDPFVFRQIMIEEEYGPLGNLPIRSVVDLGANVGLASAWFLSHFADASVFAVEADADNFAACSENLAEYGERARVLHSAAWSSNVVLSLRRNTCAADNTVQADAQSVDGESQVQGRSPEDIIQMSGFSQVDLLKIDIEGAEEEVFKADVSRWLPRVRNLCIELHGQACRDSFFGALEPYAYDHAISGELDVCTNLRPKARM